MKAIGVDIVDIERIGQSVDRFGDRFLRRVFTEQELAYCNKRLDSLAARWAAKEAVAKALADHPQTEVLYTYHVPDDIRHPHP